MLVWRQETKRYLGDIWEISRDPSSKYIHPTQKPIALPEKAIINSCPEGGIVWDGFLGSGSTLMACEKNKRKCIGMEIDTKFSYAIINRYIEMYGEQEVFLIQDGKQLHYSEILKLRC